MRHLLIPNVCHALPLGIDLLMKDGIKEESRAGDVIVLPDPVVTEYVKPMERVLFNKVRDANPFFHLAEAMWMLAGHNDAEFINQYVHDFGLRFADDGFLWGSYGYRWRHHFFDQLPVVVQRLKADPNDRRIVLSMWDAKIDLVKSNAQSHVLRDGRKDIPCNTHVYFRMREIWSPAEHKDRPGEPTKDRVLDMTVCCRSNDIIWGAYGANAVHFSFLQEYIAGMVGVGIGRYYQFSNNYHAYQSEIDRLQSRSNTGDLFYALQDNRYLNNNLLQVPLVSDPDTFDQELAARFADPYSEKSKYKNDFISGVFAPAMKAHRAFKNGFSAKEYLDTIIADDWRIACTEWVNRRTEKQTSSETRAEVVPSQDTTLGQG